MRLIARWMLVAGVATALVRGSVAVAQADPTATQTFRLSTFGGMTGTFTDVLNGHNLGITAGADLTFRRYFGLTPSVEVRGVFPVVSGTIADERWLAGGLKFEGRFGPLHPVWGCAGWAWVDQLPTRRTGRGAVPVHYDHFDGVLTGGRRGSGFEPPLGFEGGSAVPVLE